ncbi:hypothetical protein L3Q82_025389, partial [Scortum barcoo]
GRTRKMHAVEQCDGSSDMFIGTVEVEHVLCIKNIENAEVEDEDDWTQDLGDIASRHVLSAAGLEPDGEKVRAVVQLPPPEDKQELLRFMGMIQYLAKFIPNLSEVSAPLQKLLESNTEWHWEEQQKNSFDTLKQLVTNAPMAEKSKLRVIINQRLLLKLQRYTLNVTYKPGKELHIAQCAVCNEYKNSNPREPMLPHTLPGRPWEKIGTDLFHYNGAEYLLCVDYSMPEQVKLSCTSVGGNSLCPVFSRCFLFLLECGLYSKYPEITKLSDTTSRGVITALKSTLARHGIPDIVVSGNGPQYSSGEFKAFSESWEFQHVTSSPGHAQSNGQAERTVQTVKNMLKKAQRSNGDPYIALLEYRNTPIEGVGFSPAQLLMGCRLKSKLPTSTTLLTPEGKAEVHEKQKYKQLKQKSYYDRHTRQLPDLQTGENVRIQKGDIWQPAVGVDKHRQPRSFIVRTTDGNFYRRSRKHLLKMGEREFPPTDVQDNFTYSGIETNNTKSDADCKGTEVTSEADTAAGPVQSQLYHTRSGRQVKLPARYRD